MATINEVTELTLERAVGLITFDSPPVNSLTLAVREGLIAAMQRVIADPAIGSIVLICGGRTFFVGGDIASFDKPFEGPTMVEMEELIENARKPVIAAMHGMAFGGGLEIAMACHFRIATPATRCGLPEIKLGFVPGGTGTQRLPRLIGVKRALDMVTSGEDISATEARELGLVDEIVAADDLRRQAIAFAEKVVAEERPIRKVRDRTDKIEPMRGEREVFEAHRSFVAKKYRGYEAPEAAVQCIEVATHLPFDCGVLFEEMQFRRLVSSRQSAAQRYLFFAEREAAKIPDFPKDTPTLRISKIGIVGAGTMGGGIAMSFANVGLPVFLVESTREALERGLGVIRKNYEISAHRGRITQQDVDKRLGLLRGSVKVEDLAQCDLVIEAVYEDIETKKEIFRRLDATLQPRAILASNTSFLDINAIAAETRRPEAVLGLHFFSPAAVMRLVEVVRGARTAPEVLATAMKVVKRIGKVAVVAGVCRGFIGNRVLAARQREAFDLLLEGTMPWDIDRVLFEFGMPMGPFAMSDLAGLDIGWSPQKSKSASIVEALCERGRCGQKTAAGFYDYDENRTPVRSLVTEEIVRNFAAKSGRPQRVVSDAEILERCLYPMFNEGAMILQDRIAYRASDIDVVWVNGYAWPRYRGGPMFYADSIGLKAVRDKLRELADRLGPRFRPVALLERMAAQNIRFLDIRV